MNMKLLVVIAKLCELPKVIHYPITAPVIKYWTWQLNRDVARSKYWRQIRRQAEIAWAYDGAFDCYRDEEDWLERCFTNLGEFMLGQIPPIMIVRAILQHDDTPKLLRLKINLTLQAVTLYNGAINESAWKKHLLTTLIGVLGTLLILGA